MRKERLKRKLWHFYARAETPLFVLLQCVLHLCLLKFEVNSLKRSPRYNRPKPTGSCPDIAKNENETPALRVYRSIIQSKMMITNAAFNDSPLSGINFSFWKVLYSIREDDEVSAICFWRANSGLQRDVCMSVV